MHNDIREFYDAEIDRKMQEFDEKIELKEEISSKILDVSHYKKAIDSLKKGKYTFLISISLFLISLGVLGMFGFNTLTILFSFISLVKAIQAKGEINISKVVLNNEFDKYLGILNEELTNYNFLKNKLDKFHFNKEIYNKVSQVLDNKNITIELEIANIKNKIEEYNSILFEFEEKEKNSHISSIINDKFSINSENINNRVKKLVKRI